MSSAASVIAALCTTSRGVAPACCKRANRPAIGQAASSQSLVWPCRKKVTPDSAPARRCRSSHSGSGCSRVLVSGPSTRKTSGRTSRARRVVTSASPPGRSSRSSAKLRSGRSTQAGQPLPHSWGQSSRSDARATARGEPTRFRQAGNETGAARGPIVQEDGQARFARRPCGGAESQADLSHLRPQALSQRFAKSGGDRQASRPLGAGRKLQLEERRSGRHAQNEDCVECVAVQ